MNWRHLPAVCLVLVLHAAALAYALTPNAVTPPQPIEPPTLSGVLLPPPSDVKPQQKVVEKASEQPVKKAKVKPAPAKPPIPKGPASERAVQAAKPVVASAKPKATTPAQPLKSKPAATAQLQLPSTAATGMHNLAPVYPKLSRKRKEQGTVMLLLLVNSQGQVAEIKIKQSSGYERLDQAALQAVKKWQFSPAKQDGKAIDYWYEMPMNFSLNPPN